MKEVYGDIWDLGQQLFETEGTGQTAICVTTNGYVRKDGKAVMGRGVAKEAAERYPWLPVNLGFKLQFEGNQVYRWGADYNPETGNSLWLVTFPVKPEYGPRGIPGWKAKADINIIIQSILELSPDVTYMNNFENILLPRPGCGNGGLNWETEVKPIIEPLLDERYTVVTWQP